MDEALLHIDIDERLFKVKILKASDKDVDVQQCVDRMLDIKHLKRFYKAKFGISDKKDGDTSDENDDEVG